MDRAKYSFKFRSPVRTFIYFLNWLQCDPLGGLTRVPNPLKRLSTAGQNLKDFYLSFRQTHFRHTKQKIVSRKKCETLSAMEKGNLGRGPSLRIGSEWTGCWKGSMSVQLSKSQSKNHHLCLDDKWLYSCMTMYILLYFRRSTDNLKLGR